MKVLVTGGAGYVGSLVSHELLASGHQVTVLDSLLHGGRALLGLYSHPDFCFVKADVRDTAAITRALAGMEALVHLAAIVGDPACARQPQLAREVNLEASLRVAEQAKKSGVQRMVFASTCSNYGRMKDPSASVTENSELRPVSLYAETKVAVENALLGGVTPAPPCVTVLRFATVYGLSPRMRFDLTVNEFTMELAVRRKLIVFGEQFWRPYIHVRDAARAVAMVLNKPGAEIAGKVFNVGDSRENYQKQQLVEMIKGQLGNNVEIQYVHKDEDPRDYRVCFDKIQRELGFHITATVPDGIREVAEVVRQGVISDFDDPVYRN